MKTKILWKWTLGLSLVVLPFLGCGQRATNVASAADAQSTSLSGETTNPPEVQLEEDLENAPAQVVSSPKLPANTLSAPAVEIVKLAQAGVDEAVMMAYVTNSTYVFNLSSDDIIYLNDVGVPGPVVTSMIQRDQSVKTANSAPPVYTNQLVPAPGAPTPYATPPAYDVPQSTEVVENVEAAPQVNVSYTYFYDSLAPYGTWINVEGYGRCWQPTVVVANRSWQPYCDRGRWVYSDCGWYWSSDYSWGWAPFHYGRWFQHRNWGWCWAPDTLWAPSWVSWRYTSGYCGWAPLPPSACYSPGIGFTYYGRSVSVGFSFGLNARHYAFVPANNFYDRHPSRHRLHQDSANQVFATTTVTHRYDRDNRNRIINRGIPVEHVRAATRTEIQPVQIHATAQPVQTQLARVDRGPNRVLPVYQPHLPQPEGTPRLVGEGVRPATRQDLTQRNQIRVEDPLSGRQNSRSLQQSDTTSSISRNLGSGRDRRVEPATPVMRSESPVPTGNESAVPVRNNVRSDNNRGVETATRRGNESLILRGPNRSLSQNSEQSSSPQQTVPTRREANASREPMPQFSTPATPRVESVPNPTPTIPTRQFTAPVRQLQPIQSQPAQPTPRVFRQEAPTFRQPSVPAVTPSAPVQRPQSVPSYQAPRIVEQPRFVPERTMPSVRSEAPSAPRIERQVPQMQSPAVQAPARAQPSAPSSSSNSRQDRGDGRSGGRNR
jgi:hypothetical protein